jgi:hypothetical protein
VARADDLTQRLLGQGLSEAGRIRAAWFNALVRKLFGEAPPSAPAAGIEDRATWPPLRMSARHHAPVEEAARAVAEGFVTLDLEKAAPHLFDEVWMLWGDGSLRCHPWMHLIQALGARKGKSVWAIAAEVRTYAWAELRAQLPRPAAALLDGCIGLPGTMLCTMRLDSTRDPIGRVMIALAPVHDRWRALNLPLPSVDTAVVESTAAFDEREWLRIPDKIVRQVLLHNGNQLRSLRNHLMDRLFFGEIDAEAERMIEHVEKKEPPADRLDLVFAGTREERFDRIDELVGSPIKRTIELKAKELWRRPIDDLRPKLAVTDLAQLDPKTQKPAPSGKAVTMTVRVLERDQTNVEVERWRVAGIWI